MNARQGNKNEMLLKSPTEATGYVRLLALALLQLPELPVGARLGQPLIRHFSNSGVYIPTMLADAASGTDKPR